MPPTKAASILKLNMRKGTRLRQLQKCRAARKVNRPNNQAESTAPELPSVPNPSPAPQEIHAASNFIHVRESASKRKINYNEVDAEPQISLPICLVDLDMVARLFEKLLCPDCKCPKLNLRRDRNKDRGIALNLSLWCEGCEKDIEHTMTSSKIDSYTYDMNRRFVGGMLNAGLGYGGAEKVCDILGLPGISQRAFTDHVNDIHTATNVFSNVQLDEAREKVRKAHGVTQEEILDVAVSFDGSWHKRGHTSKHGIGAVIEHKTGLVVDYHVLSSYCQTCTNIGEKLQKDDPPKYTTWWEEHKHDCCRNHSGSAGSMEVAAAKALWGRSLAHNMRYTVLISDGDCKTLQELEKLKPYGSTRIVKEECINHVSKRLGTALRNVIKTEKANKVTLSGGKSGNLTKVKMTLLQRYYKNAVMSKCKDAAELRDKILATFYHSVSTDTNPRHHLCPKGLDSWCSYNKSIAKKKTHKHDGKCKTFMNSTVAKYVEPIYRRLTEDNLLSRCLLGTTQNANESFHSLVWARCPKHIFVGAKRVAIATALAVAEFNSGSRAIYQFSKSIGCRPSQLRWQKGVLRDNLRVSKAEKHEEVEVKRRRTILNVANSLREETLANSEGHLYLAGGAD